MPRAVACIYLVPVPSHLPGKLNRGNSHFALSRDFTWLKLSPDGVSDETSAASDFNSRGRTDVESANSVYETNDLANDEDSDDSGFVIQL